MRHLDRPAICSSIAGIILMVVALSLEVNPADNSAISPIVRHNYPVLLMFAVTCVPAIFAACIAIGVFHVYDPSLSAVLYWTLSLVFQALLYWILGRFASMVFRRSQKWIHGASPGVDDKPAR